MNNTSYKLKKDPVFGYRHLSPLPFKEQLKRFYEFYEKEFYKHIQKTGRGGYDVKIMSKEKKVRMEELNWLQKTYFIDYLDAFNRFLPSSRRALIDVGCGSGEFLEFMKNSGWKVLGIDPSKEFYKRAKETGAAVYNLSLEQFVNQKKEMLQKFDVVFLEKVLEHVIDPKEMILQSNMLLRRGGIIYIRVPNDFNKLQIPASKKTKKKEWWVEAPDHVNYFDFPSLEALLKHYGFEILIKTTDFPMELFLLMEDNYVDSPDLGKLCHQKRINFELSIPKETRRSIYSKLAELELGRSCMIYGRKL